MTAQHHKIGELTLTGAVRKGRNYLSHGSVAVELLRKSRWSDLKERMNNEEGSL